MRLIVQSLVLCLFVFLVLGAYSRDGLTARSDPVSLSLQQVTQAFSDAQEADFAGISHTDSNQLVIELNSALVLYDQALEAQGNATLSTELATSSANLASAISLRAVSLTEAARSTTLLRSIESYGISIIAASATSVVVLEIPDYRLWVRRRNESH